MQFYDISFSTFQGYHGDTSATFLCGDVDDEAKKLVKVIPMVSRDHFYLLSNQYLQIENTDCEECESKFKRSN